VDCTGTDVGVKKAMPLLLQGLVMNKEMMSPGHWFGLVFCVSFSALTLMVGDRKDIRPVKVPFHKSPEVLLRTSGGEGPKTETTDPSLPGKKRPLKRI